MKAEKCIVVFAGPATREKTHSNSLAFLLPPQYYE